MTSDILSIILLLTLFLSVLGLTGVVIWLLRINTQNRVTGRADSFIGIPDAINETTTISQQTGSMLQSDRFEGLRGKVNRALSFFSTEKLQLKISSAYWPISDVEFIFIRIAATLLGLVVGTLIPRSIIGGIGLGFLFFIIPGFVLDAAIRDRRKKFQGQLLDVLVLIKGAVLAGYSLPQSLDLAVKEIASPACDEFSRVLREVRFGFPLEQALVNLSNRMENDDLQIVVTAILINAQVGGNLSTVLEAVIDTIRERIHLFGEIRSLTSYARFVGNAISFLPFIAGLAIFFLSPDYFANVKDSLLTQIIFALALLGVIIGNIVIRQIVKIHV